MKNWIVLAVIAALGIYFYRRSKHPLEKHYAEQRDLQTIGDVAVSQGVQATPPLAFAGEEPLTTFNAAPTVAKISQDPIPTSMFPIFGQLRSMPGEIVGGLFKTLKLN